MNTAWPASSCAPSSSPWLREALPHAVIIMALWCNKSCPLLISLAAGGLAARGQPVALASAASQSPTFSWASASEASFSLEVTVWPVGNESVSTLVWSLTNIPGPALRSEASAADGTERVPWRLGEVVSNRPHWSDLWVDARLRDETRRKEVQRTSFQTRSCLGALQVRYGDAEACACGQELSPSASAVPPSTVKLAAAAAAAAAAPSRGEPPTQYVLMLLDRDALSWQQPSLSPLLHAAYADVDADRLASAGGVDVSTERALIAYMGPAGLGPGSYSAPHRYSWRAYLQPPARHIPPFPSSFDRTSFALGAWLAANGLAPLAEADDLFRSEAALPNHASCDGMLRVAFDGDVEAACTTALSTSVVANAPHVAFAYPYFEDVLLYALVAVDPTHQKLLWLGLNIEGTLINAGTRLPAPNATVAMPYAPPAAGSSALFLLYVQPAMLDGDATAPLASREGFDPAAWAASVGIARPSASNALRVVGVSGL